MRRRTVVEVQAPLPLAPPLQPTRFPIYSQIGKLKRQYLEIRSKTSFVRQVSPKNFFSLGPTSPLGIYEVRKPEPVHPEGLLSREDEKRAIEQFKLLIVVVNRLAERYRETKTKRGTLLEYHQKIPLLAAFGGFAAMRLGVEGVNRWRKELEEIFCTVNFDSKQEVKFGRRSGKTYMASLIIACLLCTQVKCNGIFMCVDKALASENADTITYFITEILEDPKQPIRGKIVKGSRSEGIVRVETQFGTNKVRCSTDPKRSSIRGKGDNRGFFFVDESDFFEQKAWDQIQPIWSMPMLVALYTSQGYTMSPANKMIQNAVLANGERIWRQYRITPGRISLIISEDYDRTTRDSTGRLLFGLPDENTSNRHGASHGKGGGGGSNANGADNTEALPIRSIRRPWYDPVMQTLSDRMTELTIQEDERRNRLSLLTTTTTTEHLRYHTTLPTLPYHSIETTRTIAKNNAELEALITKEIRDGASVWSAGECVWLMTLPAQQDPGNMIRLRAMMGKEAFDREMLSAAPDTGISLYPTFDEEDITKLFLLENRRSIFPTSTGGPIRWIIGFDPGGSGPNQQSASDTVIVSALIFPPEDPRNSPHGIDRMQSLSLRQQLVLTGIEIVPKAILLNMPKVAELIMRHIAGLWAKYSQYKHLPVFIVPENNTEYAAYGLDLHIMDINLQRQCLFEHNENIQVLYEKDQHGTKAMLAGIHTHSGSKTNGVTRLGARLKRGPTSICLSREFGSNTTTSDGSQMQPTEDMLARMRREFRSFRTIPPTLENKKKVVTYNGKCIGETDDFIMALLMVDLGNAEIEKQALMLIG